MSKLDEIRARHDTCADRGTTMYADRAYLLERIAELERAVSEREMEKAQADAGWALELEKAEAALERVIRWWRDNDQHFTGKQQDRLDSILVNWSSGRE